MARQRLTHPHDRPYRITRGDLFYIRAEDKHAYASVNDLVLQNVIYCPDRLKLNVDWAAHIPGFLNARGEPHWRLSSSGMAQVRQTISQLEQESQKHDPVAKPDGGTAVRPAGHDPSNAIVTLPITPQRPFRKRCWTS